MYSINVYKTACPRHVVTTIAVHVFLSDLPGVQLTRAEASQCYVTGHGFVMCFYTTKQAAVQHIWTFIHADLDLQSHVELRREDNDPTFQRLPYNLSMSHLAPELRATFNESYS